LRNSYKVVMRSGVTYNLHRVWGYFFSDEEGKMAYLGPAGFHVFDALQDMIAWKTGHTVFVVRGEDVVSFSTHPVAVFPMFVPKGVQQTDETTGEAVLLKASQAEIEDAVRGSQEAIQRSRVHMEKRSAERGRGAK
jgi:hypothetical protein